jgi:hypothetical protein
MPAGQLVSVVVCSSSAPAGGAVQLSVQGCQDGLFSWLVPAYLPFPEASSALDSALTSFDPATASGLFSFGFGLVVFFYLLGLKGSVLIKPFWSGWR